MESAPRKLFLKSLSSCELPCTIWIQGFIVKSSLTECTIADGTAMCQIFKGSSLDAAIGSYVMVIGVLEEDYVVRADQLVDISRDADRIPGWWLEVFDANRFLGR